MNTDYDIKELDRQKIKIDRGIEEVGKWIIDQPKVVEVKVETIDWKSSFQELVRTFQAADLQKKYELKMNYKTLAFSNKKQ